jgi:phage gp29-like protein
LIKRYILGQILSSESDATGLGSGVADLHLDTLLQIIRYDATNLEETITHELVRRIKDWNWPSARGVDVRFRIDTESPDVEAKLEAWARAYEMGCKLRARDVMDLVGASMPDPDEDDILQSPEFAEKQEADQMSGGDAAGNEKFPDTDTHAKQLADKLGVKQNPAGPPQAGPPPQQGEKVTAVENGKWKTKQIPYGDTGERRRAKGKVLRKFGYSRRVSSAKV